MTNPPTEAADLHGSVQQTLSDLTKLARELPEEGPASPGTATKLTKLSRELGEAAAIVRALPGQPPEPARLPWPVLGAAAVRGLLESVATALDLPAPATAEDEMTFLRLRSDRATETLRAIMNVLSHQPATDLDLAWCSAWLDEALEEYPAAGYEHSPMSSRPPAR
jgi:hypothetical protein